MHYGTVHVIFYLFYFYMAYTDNSIFNWSAPPPV